MRHIEQEEFFGGAKDDTSAQVTMGFFVAVRKHYDPPRGDCLLLIHIGMIDATPTNPKGRWYDMKKIPFDSIASMHREIILPNVLAKWTEWKKRTHE